MRYRIIVPAMRHTLAYRALSKAAPNARGLLEWLVTGDCTTAIPGLVAAGWRTLMEQLGWADAPEETQRAVWQELLASGLIEFDPDARLIWLPWMVSDEYLPNQPQSLRAWSVPWSELPDCALKHRAWSAFRAAFARREHRRSDKKAEARREGTETAGAVYARMFAECCPEPRCRPVAAAAAATPQATPPPTPRKEPPETPQKTPSDTPSETPDKTRCLTPREGPSLQEQDQEPEQEQDLGVCADPPPADDPPPRDPEGDAAHSAQIARRAMARFDRPPDAKTRWQAPNWKALVLQALVHLERGGQEAVSVPRKGSGVRIDQRTLDALYVLFCKADPTDEELTQIGAVWKSGSYYRSFDRETKQIKPLTPAWLASDERMFFELLGHAQQQLAGTAPKGPKTLMDDATAAKLKRL